MNYRKSTFIVIGLCCVLATRQASAQDSGNSPSNISAKINAASQQLLDGNVDDALAAYDSVAQTIPANHELNYNRGIAYYQNGNIEQARSLFTASTNTTDNSLAARSSFNLGNCDYSDAIQQAAQDPAVAIQSLDKAIGHYRSSLRMDSDDADARTNIELALLMRKQLQQKQDQDEQDQDEQDQDEQDQDEQDQDQDQDEQKKEKQEKENEESDQEEGDQEESDQEESDSEKQGQDEKNQGNQGQEPTTQEKSTPEKQGEQEEQPSGERHEDTDESEPEQSQPEKGDGQKTPNDTESSPSGQATNQDATQEMDPTTEPISPTESENGKLDPQEAMKMLQAIRDRDLMRRMQKLRQVQRRHIPVEKDW